MSPQEPHLDLRSASTGASPITPDQIAEYLQANPGFFQQYSSLLSEMSLPHPQSGQAISLVERQASVLRERIKSMELKLAELLRHGQENDAIAASIQQWIRGLFLHSDSPSLPRFLADSLARVFTVPQVGIGLWKVADAYQDENWVVSDQDDYVSQIDRLSRPICGHASTSSSVVLLPEAGRDAESIAVLPLRVGISPEAFGVLVLGSPDSRRFSPDLGVAFLERISEIASAALSRFHAKP